MDMDEDGRNGRKWHLAQQITQPVIMHILSITTNHIPCNALYISTTSTTCNHTKTTTNIPCNQSAYFINNSHNSHIMQLSITIFQQQFTHHVIALSHRYWGDFYFSYKYQKFSPIRYHNNLQFVNK